MTDHLYDFEHIHYLDNASTSWPKPRAVLDAMYDFAGRFGVNPGRSSYDLARHAGEKVDEAREELARLLGVADRNRILFSANATDALNILLPGLVKTGDRVITSTAEHNSVIRPLHHLARERKLDVVWLPVRDEGRIDPSELKKALEQPTCLVVINHASNVTGIAEDLIELGSLCRDAGALFMIDAAQTAGLLPIDLSTMPLDAVAFTGHKSLMGPMGTGGFALAEHLDISPLRTGGTGVDSALLYQPERLPYRHEAGTPNLPGIAGLQAGLKWLRERGIEASYQREMHLLAVLENGLRAIPGLSLLGPEVEKRDVPVLSFTLEGISPSETGTILDVEFGIAVRTGLHCAPLLHKQYGTGKHGAVRMSLGRTTSEEQIEAALAAVSEIAGEFAR